ncbi:Ribokinase-like protein [Suillus cothurnatus]|nr:Ribokinase-like protein [Suillus cothurnatus]
MPVPRSIIQQIKQIIPPLNGTLHKGQSGRVGVLGGALDYTGAPFFAAISALRLGADLSHVICSPTAAQAIKSYSPDLIVHPILGEESSYEKVESELRSLLSRLHVLVMGPGLGREGYMQTYARLALSIAREQTLFVVLDADALYMVGKELSLVKGYRRVFKRLSESAGVSPDVPTKERAGEVSRLLGGVVVLEKGPTDLIASDTTGEAASPEASKLDEGDEQRVKEVVEVDVEGGLKRCGGQGDVLSGTVGAMLAWGKCYEDGAFGDGSVPTSRLPLLAAVGGSMVTRTSSRMAFQLQGRGLVTQDMLPLLGKSFSEVFGEDLWAGDKGRL